MIKKIDSPALIKSAGNKEKIIKEYFGRVSSNDSIVSIAFMHSPGGWCEPGQTPCFDEFSVVLRGTLHIKTKLSELDVNKKNFDTLALQRELTNRGYKLPKSTKKDGSFDGIYGPETRQALTDWQEKNKQLNK